MEKRGRDTADEEKHPQLDASDLQAYLPRQESTPARSGGSTRLEGSIEADGDCYAARPKARPRARREQKDVTTRESRGRVGSVCLDMRISGIPRVIGPPNNSAV